MTPTIMQLPPEVQHHIFQWILPRKVIQLKRMCVRFHWLLSDSHFARRNVSFALALQPDICNREWYFWPDEFQAAFVSLSRSSATDALAVHAEPSFVPPRFPHFQGLPHFPWNRLELSGFGGSFELPPSATTLTSLSLSNNAMNGPLPEAILTVCQLRELIVHKCGITGNISSLDALGKLTHLDLSSNKISGRLNPGFFENMQGLVYLDLQDNCIEGPIPNLQSLISINTLCLARNCFDGPFPQLNGLTSLTYLNFYDNSLSGPLHESVYDLHVLQYLKVAENNFTGPVLPALGGLTELVEVDLSGNAFNGVFPWQDVEDGLPRLRWAHVEGNCFEQLSNKGEDAVGWMVTLPTLIGTLAWMKAKGGKGGQHLWPITTWFTTLLFSS
ncbi:hypothetical protein BC830DRAFT_1080705 [Chytriomyces sp. MP71]|nr:hypothetical protein BC830DRAFT_1080705 [Chytriomyces sp. MP71]